MSDEELAEFLAYNAYCEECYVKNDDSCCYPDGTCKQKHIEWLQSEAEQERIWKIDTYSRQKLVMESGLHDFCIAKMVNGI